ncbi:MAG: LLM class F420-dependent oxidoreductase [Acidimicrobiia bacterium]
MIDIGWFGIGSGAYADPEGVIELCVAAEDLGYESVWVGEHPVLIDPHESPSPLPPLSDLLDPVTVLSYAAARTERIGLGTGVILLPLRNPLILAKQLASLDVLSKGRVLAGFGVGYVPGENAAIGTDFTKRGRITDEYLDAMRTMWDDDQPEYRGEFTNFGGIQSRPQPPRRLPIHMGGFSERALRRAVTKCEGWYGFFQDLANTERVLGELARITDEVGRPEHLGPLEITVTPPGDVDADTVAKFEALGVHRLVLLRDFGDMAGGPDVEKRGLFLRHMEDTAKSLSIG